MSDPPKFIYTGQETLLKQVAGLARMLYEPFFDAKPAEVQFVEATEADVRKRAFKRYLEKVKLPGEDGLTECQRLKHNAMMFEGLLVQARKEIAAEAKAYEENAHRLEEERKKLQTCICGAEAGGATLDHDLDCPAFGK